MIINLTDLSSKTNAYIQEFYDAPKVVKNTNAAHVSLLKSLVGDIVRKQRVMAEIASLNKKSIPSGSADDGTACLKRPLKFKKMLGEGYFGKVYKVSSSMAVKIVNLDRERHMRNEKRNGLKAKIEAEFELSKRAGVLGVGPKIYDCYTCCSQDGACFQVMYMQLLQGMTLREWIESNPSEALKQKVKDMLKVQLAVLHNNKIMHSDLHQENVLVIGNRKNASGLYIIDYGLATNFKNRVARSIEYERNVEHLFEDWRKYDGDRGGEIETYVIGRMLDNKDIVFE
jgi:tRNA A-37 threonylcarbamoyl transferase component Bud32